MAHADEDTAPLKLDIDVIFESHREGEDTARERPGNGCCGVGVKYANDKAESNNRTKAKTNRSLNRSAVMAQPSQTRAVTR